MYERYKRARDTAWRVLTEIRITEFPVDLKRVTQELGIKLKPFGDTEELLKLIGTDTERDALTYRTSGGEFYILYNENTFLQRVRFSIAHELGHIVLGTSEYRDSFTENEADIFARDLLMPAVICKHHKLKEAKEIAEFFNVSDKAAGIRAERIKELLKRGKWFTSKLEKEYYKIYLKNKV